MENFMSGTKKSKCVNCLQCSFTSVCAPFPCKLAGFVSVFPREVFEKAYVLG